MLEAAICARVPTPSCQLASGGGREVTTTDRGPPGRTRAAVEREESRGRKPMGRHGLVSAPIRKTLAKGRWPLGGRRGLSRRPAREGALEEGGADAGFPNPAAPVPQDLK